MKFPVLFSPKLRGLLPLVTVHLYVILFPAPDRISSAFAVIVKLLPPTFDMFIFSNVGGVLSIFTV